MRGRGRRSGRTAGSAGRCAAARGCAPTSPRPARSRTSPGTARAGSPRCRARPRPRTRRSSRAGAPGDFSRSAARAARSSSSATSTRGEPSSLRGAPQHASPRILGPVDAVAEAHDPLAAVEEVSHVALGVAARATSSSIGSTRAGAPPCSGPDSVPTAPTCRRAVGAGRGGDTRGEGRGVQTVLGGRDPVGVERRRRAAGRPRRASGSGTAPPRSRPGSTSDSGTGGCVAARGLSDDRERRRREPREVVARLARGSMSTSCREPPLRAERRKAACRSAITEPLGSCSSIRSACGMPGSKLSSTSSPQTFSNG